MWIKIDEWKFINSEKIYSLELNENTFGEYYLEAVFENGTRESFSQKFETKEEAEANLLEIIKSQYEENDD